MGSTRHDIGNHLQILASLAAEEPFDDGARPQGGLIGRFADLLAASAAVYRVARPVEHRPGHHEVPVQALFNELQRALPGLGGGASRGMTGDWPSVSVDAAVRLAMSATLLHACVGPEPATLEAQVEGDAVLVALHSERARSTLHVMGQAARVADALELAEALLSPVGGRVDPTRGQDGFELKLPGATPSAAATRAA